MLQRCEMRRPQQLAVRIGRLQEPTGFIQGAEPAGAEKRQGSRGGAHHCDTIQAANASSPGEQANDVVARMRGLEGAWPRAQATASDDMRAHTPHLGRLPMKQTPISHVTLPRHGTHTSSRRRSATSASERERSTASSKARPSDDVSRDLSYGKRHALWGTST